MRLRRVARRGRRHRQMVVSRPASRQQDQRGTRRARYCSSSKTGRTPIGRSGQPRMLPGSKSDRAFATQLVYGTVQRVRPLDHGIETLGRRPVRRLDPEVRAALRLGAYQLAHCVRARPRGGRRDRRARASRRARARGGVHERGDASPGERARASCWRRSRTRPWPRLRFATPTPTGWPRPGGGSSAEPRRSRSCRRRTSPPRPSSGSTRGVARPGRARGRRIPTSRTRWSSSGSPTTGSSKGSCGRRAGARSLRGSPSVLGPGSACSTCAPRPAERRPSSSGDVVAVELHEGRARELERPAPGSARRTSTSCRPRPRSAVSAHRLRPGPRRRAVLGARNARVPA